MLWTRRLWLKLQTLFWRERAAQQLDDELQFHLQQQAAENLAAGMSEEEARNAAMRIFGNTTVLKEQTRDTWGWIRLEQIAARARHDARPRNRSAHGARCWTRPPASPIVHGKHPSCPLGRRRRNAARVPRQPRYQLDSIA